MGQPAFAALHPEGEKPPVHRRPLAPRVRTLTGRRLAIVLTMPPGSGLEEVEADLRALLGAVAPGAVVRTLRRKDFMVDDPDERAALVEAADAAVLVIGPTATSAFVGVAYASGLEAAGLPTALVVPASVRATADHSIGRVGVPLRVARTATDAVDALTRPLLDVESDRRTIPAARPPEVACTGTLAEVTEHFHAQGWTDGLPIVPPTAEAVEVMLGGTTRHADEVVTTTLRPEGLPARVREVAIAAVMAGARPEQLPAILAAAEVHGDVEFESMTRSVNSFAFAYMVHGPAAREAGLTGGLGALGPGHRGNATLGRALGLLLRTAGGARLGVTTAATQGNPASWAFAFAENEDASPWPPAHVADGFAPTDGAVTVFSGGWSHFGNFYYGSVDDLVAAASAIDTLTGVLVLLSAKRAALLARDGWTKDGLEEHVWRGATQPVAELRAGPFFPLMRALMERPPSARGPASWPADYLTRGEDELVPRFPRAGVRVAVVGADISSTMQLWALTRHATVPIDPWR
ncbi:MAG TPA: hypothetical protein VNT55_05200 [Baekduia sp.]|nr:hypothetical protein [Baekduia sp.]